MTERAEGPAYLREHRLHGEVLRFELDPEEQQLRTRAHRSNSGRAAKTLVKEGPLRIALAVLEPGAALEEHKVAGPVSIHVLHGVLKLSAPQGEVEIGPGGLIALDGRRSLRDCTQRMHAPRDRGDAVGRLHTSPAGTRSRLRAKRFFACRYGCTSASSN